MITLEPIGYARTSYTETSQVPKGAGAQHTAEGAIELLPAFEAGLTDIEGFSHLHIIWIFDRAGRHELVGKAPTDGLVHGVFATRSPRRPNPIALSVVELLGRDGPRLRVRGVDMLDGSPVVDIKPYTSSVPAEKLRRGWLEAAEARARDGGVPNGGVQG